MPALLPFLLAIAVSQVNHPTIDPSGGAAKILFAVDVTNTTSAPVRLTRLSFETWPTNRRQYALDRMVAPGATARIPVVRELGFAVNTKVEVTVFVTMATSAGERIESVTVPMNLKVDRAVRVR